MLACKGFESLTLCYSICVVSETGVLGPSRISRYPVAYYTCGVPLLGRQRRALPAQAAVIVLIRGIPANCLGRRLGPQRQDCQLSRKTCRFCGKSTGRRETSGSRPWCNLFIIAGKNIPIQNTSDISVHLGLGFRGSGFRVALDY